MKKIGVTGGIGSGKSIVCKVFEQLGVPVFHSDAEARDILEDDEMVREEVKKLFGADSYFPDGRADRKHIASIVFKDEQQLIRLNAIIHPVVFRRFDAWCKKQKASYVLKEAAILFESGSDKGLDHVITVSAPEDLKISRTMNRDKITREAVLERMSRQWSETERIARSEFIITNDDKLLVIPQVVKLHEQFMR